MKRFRYNLQVLLTLRERAEQKALEQYAQALLSREQALARRKEIDRAQAESWSRWRAELSKGCAAGELTQWQASNRSIEEQRQSADKALSQAEIEVNRARQATLVARRDREAVEKHREKQRLGHQQDLAREEQNALDELGQRRLLSSLVSSSTNPSYE